MSNTGPESTVPPAAPQTGAQPLVDSTRRQRGQRRWGSRLMVAHAVPGRIAPAIAGATVVALALPVFVLAGWDLAGWGLGAVLWIAAQALALVLTRLRIGMDNLAGSSVVGLGMMFRPVAVMVVAVAVAASNAELGIAAALVYALAYSLELGVSLALYFGSPAER